MRTQRHRDAEKGKREKGKVKNLLPQMKGKRCEKDREKVKVKSEDEREKGKVNSEKFASAAGNSR